MDPGRRSLTPAGGGEVCRAGGDTHTRVRNDERERDTPHIREEIVRQRDERERPHLREEIVEQRDKRESARCRVSVSYNHDTPQDGT